MGVRKPKPEVMPNLLDPATSPDGLMGIAEHTLEYYLQAEKLFHDMRKRGSETFTPCTNLIIFLCQASIQASARLRAMGQRPRALGAPQTPVTETAAPAEVEADFRNVSTEELDRMVGNGDDPV